MTPQDGCGAGGDDLLLLIRNSAVRAYLSRMSMRTRLRLFPPGFVVPCQPQPTTIPPSGSGWVHEIKHDGYRLMVGRDAQGVVRLVTRTGKDWTDRFPHILKAAQELPRGAFLIDGEAVCFGDDGRSSFTLLRRRQAPAVLSAFDLLTLEGENIRRRPLLERKAALAKLLGSPPAGILYNDHTDDDGPTVFKHAWIMGLEGIVSKRTASSYCSGTTRDWLKAKNPESEAVRREREEDWNR